MACDTVAHMEVQNPTLAKAMWGERRGCFEKPKQGQVNSNHYEKIDKTMCKHFMNSTLRFTPEFYVARDHTYTKLIQHPLTNTFDKQDCLKATDSMTEQKQEDIRKTLASTMA